MTPASIIELLHDFRFGSKSDVAAITTHVCLLLTTDICGLSEHVGFVPTTDQGGAGQSHSPGGRS